MRILIVEDEPSLSEQLRASLTQSGYVVDLAPDGLEGQYLATEYPYDLAVVDLGVPTLTGGE